MIRKATIADLEKVSEFGYAFLKETQFLEFDQQAFIQSWAQFLELNIGVIFILEDFYGILGAIAYPDPNSGKMLATEMFWIVLPEYRGKGLSLVQEYESWAHSKGCTRAIMVHMADSMPDKLKAVYKRNGYREMETHYIKELR